MPGRLDGKVALITGGASGIGRATALAFAREGAKLIIADLHEDGGQQTVHMITEQGGEATFVQVDVSRAAETAAMINTAVEAYGRLDCAHNNAGVGARPRVRLHEIVEENWDRVLDINLKGVWLCMKYEIAQMLMQGGGAIVNTASIMGLVGSWSRSAAYNASKHGVVGLTKTAALEYATAGIRVNAVCPGYIRTPLIEATLATQPEMEAQIVARHPVGRMGRPEEIAEAVVWLCSDAASFVTGHTMTVDGGYVAQ
jgi:NAD(P)-dependent dehydrogenase (short-subunit alcohol dehydrogenase family)